MSIQHVPTARTETRACQGMRSEPSHGFHQRPNPSIEGRATSGFASCRPPLMSNVSPQLNVAVASSVRRSREQCGVAHQTVTRAGDAPKCGEPSAHVVEAPSKGHGAEAPRKSKLRSAGLGRSTLRKAGRQRVYAIRERKSSARCHTAGEEGSL